MDGSLRDVAWYTELFARIREDNPFYQIAIIHITAQRETIINRANARAVVSGRVVPRELLEASMLQVPKSVAALGPLADLVAEVTNDDGCPLYLGQLKAPGHLDGSCPSWAAFHSAWRDYGDNTPSEERLSKTPTESAISVGTSRTQQSTQRGFGFCRARARRTFTGQVHELRNYRTAMQVYDTSYPQVCLRCAVQDHSEFGHVCTCYNRKPPWLIQIIKRLECVLMGLLFRLGWYDSPPNNWSSKQVEITSDVQESVSLTPTLLAGRSAFNSCDTATIPAKLIGLDLAKCGPTPST